MTKNNKNNDRKIERLINKAWYTNDKKKASELAHQVLEMSPENTEALLILVDNFEEENDNAREELLLRTLKSIDDKRNNYSEEVKRSFFVSTYYRLAYTLFSLGKFDETLEICQKTLEILETYDDVDDLIEFEIEDDMRNIQYRTLIELKRWHDILSMTMKDESHGASWAYARLVATWVLSNGDAALCANMFWDALSFAPNVPFYMLGYYDEPDDDESEDFVFALLFSGILAISEDFHRWFTRGTILFGLLTNRFEDERERDYVIDVLDALGGYEEYEKMRNLVFETDDASVIEILAANKCLKGV